MKGRLLGLVAAGLLASAPVIADEPEGFFVSPLIGLTTFDDTVNDDLSFSLGLGYRFDNPWAVEFVYSQVSTDLERGGDADFSRWHVDGLYHFDHDDVLRPYISFGMGLGDIDSATFNDDGVMLNVGAGLKYAFSDATSLRADVKAFEGDLADIGFALGLGIHHSFGKQPMKAAAPAPRDSDRDGVIDDNDQCPNSPAGSMVDARGCAPDDDRDGVPNSADQCPNSPAGSIVNARGCSPDNDQDGVPNDMDKCPNTPRGATVDAMGCPSDSDRDGVADGRDQCPETSAGARVDERGCYAVLAETVRVELNVQFDNNSADARPEHRTEARRVFEFMRQYPNTTVTIEGHTDSRGQSAYNRDLSQRRANTIAGILVNEMGINGSRVKAVGYGEDRPIATNETPEGRQQNRRVVGVVEATVETIQRR